MERKSNEILSDPMIPKIKALSRIEINSNNSNENSFQIKQTKFQSLLLPEEWLELSDAYLRLPPTLSDQSFIQLLQVIIIS